VVAVPSDELLDYFERTRTPEDEELMVRSLAAEAEGDAQAALDLYRQTPHIVRAPHELYLRELIALGAAAPSWVVNRWVVQQASLWMLLSHDLRTDDAVRLALMTCYELDQDLDSAGLFRLVSDLVTGRRLQLLDIGAMVGADVGQHMLGRAVPIEQAPGLMFETRPRCVDQQTALDAATRRRVDLLPGWLIAIGCGIDDGRLPYAVGRMGGTPLSSDVPHDRLVGGAVAWCSAAGASAKGEWVVALYMQSLRLHVEVMAVLTVRDVPDDVRSALARGARTRGARTRGQSLQAHLLGVLTRQAAFTRNAEVLAEIEEGLAEQGGADVDVPDAASVIDAARRARSETLSRPRRAPGGAA
jgi:hypothetical protein